jgi:metal-responsive CopG/Arc/MetJ family transcriptional regulator
MKVKTSITLSEELLAAIDRENDVKNRSVLIEEATWSYLRRRRRLERDRRELETINRDADALNAEALDVLEFQDPT